MEDAGAIGQTSIGMSLLGILLAIVVFVVVWIVGGILFSLFDNVRGLGNDRLQALFREIMVPGVGGAAAMGLTEAWIPRANLRFVFFGFAAILLLVTGAYLGFLGPLSEQAGITFWDLVLGALSLVASVAGAYIAAKDSL